MDNIIQGTVEIHIEGGEELTARIRATEPTKLWALYPMMFDLPTVFDGAYIARSQDGRYMLYNERGKGLVPCTFRLKS